MKLSNINVYSLLAFIILNFNINPMQEEGVRLMKLKQIILNKKVYKSPNMMVSLNRPKRLLEVIMDGENSDCKLVLEKK